MADWRKDIETTTQMDARKSIFFAGKLTLTLGAFYWLFSHSDFSSALAAFHGGGAWLVAAAILAHLVAFGVGCFRWWLYLRHTERRIRFQGVFLAYLLGLFFKNVLPTNFGGDLVRVARLGFSSLRVRQLIGKVRGPVLDAVRLCRSYLVNVRLLSAGIGLSVIVQSLFVVSYYLSAGAQSRDEHRPPRPVRHRAHRFRDQQPAHLRRRPRRARRRVGRLVGCQRRPVRGRRDLVAAVSAGISGFDYARRFYRATSVFSSAVACRGARCQISS